MLDLHALLDGLPEDLTILFFAAFARFEYSLMRCGYLIHEDGLAYPDWHRLSDELGNDFFVEVRDAHQIRTLIYDQPKRLIARNGVAGFGPPLPIVSNVRDLFTSAKQVRHNLFHGNKLFAANRTRDQQLMREVLWLLEQILQQRPTLKAIFDEPQV